MKLQDMCEVRRKYELRTLYAVVLENSTIIPFRWFCNKYMCFYCCCPFLESSKLKEHMREEHSDIKVTRVIRSLLTSCKIKLDVSDISCKLCPKKLQTFEDFLDHVSIKHQLKFNKEVSRCIFTFKLADDVMSCIECGENFKFFGTLLRHSHKYHNKASPFLCQICGEGFVGRANVDSHIRNVHASQDLHCSECNKTFPNASAMKSHVDQVHKKKLKCPECPEILGSKYLKLRHLALVHDFKMLQFNCDQCPSVFTKKSGLVHHKSRVHLKEKTVTCEICGFKVFNKEMLMRHMVRHDDSRPFECEYCKKTFQRKKTLDFHKRIHTNDRRYVCKECGRAFVQTTSLKLHMRVHHSNAKEGST